MRFNRSEPGLIFSSVAHASLFVAALIGFAQPRTFADTQEAVPVEVVSETELRQMMRGERAAPKPLPAPQQKADRVAETNERKPDAPLARQDVAVPPPPQRDPVQDTAAEAKAADAKAAQDKAAQAKAAEAKAAQDKAEQEAQERAMREARAAEAQRQRDAAERQRVASAAAAAAAAEKARQAAAEKARAEAEEEERREAELERQRKQEEARRAAEVKRMAEEQRAAEEKRRKEAEARALKEKIDREAAAEARQQAELDRQKKAEEARKAAEAKKQAEARREAEEKARRAAEAKQAAAQSEQKSFSPSDIQKLLQNKQNAATTGSTGPQQQRQASLGSQTGQDQKLNPSQREALIGLLREQMARCLSIPPGSNPAARPSVRVSLNADGSLAGAPSIAGGDAAVGAAAVRAIRGCAPYQIPARFAAFYNDWRSLLVTIDVSDL